MSILVLRSSAAAPPAGNLAPSWVGLMSANFWAAVGGSALDLGLSNTNRIVDLDPCPSETCSYSALGQHGVITGWSGGCFATGLGTYGRFVVAGGGHSDYYGNEQYHWDPGTRTWTRPTNPYSGSISWPIATGVFPDGSPTVSHTYRNFVYVPSDNAIVWTRVMTNSPLAESISKPAICALNDFSWTYGATSGANNVSSAGWSVYDANRHVIWTHADGGEFGKFGMSAKTWTSYGLKQLLTYESLTVFVQELDAIISLQEYRDGNLVYLDPNSPSTSAQALTQSGKPGSLNPVGGFVWSPTLGGLIYWGGGEDVYSIIPNNPSDWKNATWVWALITSGSNTVAPGITGNGVYGRLVLVSYDDAEILLTVNSTTGTDGNVHAYKVS